MSAKKIYGAIKERIFRSKFRSGMREVDFSRDEIIKAAADTLSSIGGRPTAPFR